MRTYFSVMFLFAIVCSNLHGQISVNAVKIKSPFPNEEICLQSTLPIAVSFRNSDSINRSLLVHFVIRNIVTKIVVYTDSDTLLNIPPGVSVDTGFAPYISNPNLLKQLGSFLACAYVTAVDSLGNPIIDWKFADSSCIRIFGIRTTALPFNDPSDNYSKILNGDIPDQTKWVSLGATVIEGDNETWDPPPPRYDKKSGGVGPDNIFSPVIRLDRSDDNGNIYSGSSVGDTLISFPFNLLGQSKIGLAFDFMRSGKHLYPDLWDGEMMIGAEHTVLNKNREVIRPGDSLIVEFKDPAESSCNPSASGWNRIVGIDGGRDLEFRSLYIKLTDTTVAYHFIDNQFITIPITQHYFTNNFRFRLRLKAKSDDNGTSTKDDNDPWYIDHISLQVPRLPEIEVRWARVITPYAKIPFTTASALPVCVSVRNNGTDVAIAFNMNVLILDSSGKTVYSQKMNVTSLRGGADSVLFFPNWNAQNAKASSLFTITAERVSSFESYTQDDDTYSTFYLNVETGDSAVQEFAYDDAGISPQINDGNDIPPFIGKSGAGIGFYDTSGSYAVKFTLPFADTIYGARLYFGSQNLTNEAIRISLYKNDSSSCIPIGDAINQPPFNTMSNTSDRFAPYYFPKPVFLDAGTYWLSVSQLGYKNFMIGADLSRGGGEIRVSDSLSPQITPVHSSPYGTQWSSTQNNGDISCAFAIEIPAGSGKWQPWMPNTGWWPVYLSGNGHQSIQWYNYISSPYTLAGSYTPMIRVMAGSLGSIHVSVTNKSNDKSELEIYPNPASGNSVTVKFPSTKNVSHLYMFDVLGRKVYDQDILSGISQQDISITQIPEGIYYIELSSSSGTASHKFLRSK